MPGKIMGHPDMILLNGNVITMADARPKAEAVAISRGKIVGVGTTQSLRQLTGRRTRVVDLRGKTVVPGFIDAHNHMMLYGLTLSAVDCKTPPLKSISEIVSRIRQRAEGTQSADWIMAYGYAQFALEQKRHPDKLDLDEATTKHPVFLRHFSFHACVVNSLALRLADIGPETPNPAGGEVVKDPRTGEPTGVLLERAQLLAEKALPPPTLREMREAINLASADYVKHGITTVQDPGWLAHDTRDYLAAYRAAERSNRKLVRVAAMVNGDRLDKYLERPLRLPPKGSKVKLGPVKLFADGVVNLRTAAVTMPYSDRESEKGLLVIDKDDLTRKVVKAAGAGLQVAIHTIGDRAVDLALDAFEAAKQRFPRRELRNRLVHAVITREDQIERINRLGVLIDAQPAFLKTLGGQFSQAVGGEQNRKILPFSTMLRHGISVCGTSDAPCSDLPPLIGIVHCVGRQTRSGETLDSTERISARDGLRMYTSLAAYNCSEEGTKGSVETGKFADLVVLSDNPLELDLAGIANTRVEMTMIGGRVVYEKEKLAGASALSA